MMIVEYILAALKLLPELIAEGQDAYAMIQRADAAAKAMAAQGRGPTDDEWAALHGTIDSEIKQLEE